MEGPFSAQAGFAPGTPPPSASCHAEFSGVGDIDWVLPSPVGMSDANDQRAAALVQRIQDDMRFMGMDPDRWLNIRAQSAEFGVFS